MGRRAATALCIGGLALWGVRRGARWVWWTVLAGGLPGFAATLAIHGAVGYTDALHLAPVWLAVGLYAVGLATSWRYLGARPHSV